MDLVVKKNGKEVIRITLEQGVEYIAGRSEDCAIRLEGERGISRHHIKFSSQNGVWAAQLLSRYGALIYEGEAVQALELTEGALFSVPPYEFHWVSTLVTRNPVTATLTEPSEPEKSMVVHIPSQNKYVPEEVHEETFHGNFEATQAGASSFETFLKVFYGSSQKAEVFRLEGNVWIAGRDPNCEIFLDDRHMSRRQFELTRTSDGFFITDLQSANGTFLNNDALVPDEPQKIISGDQITVMDVVIDFEIRDPKFESLIASHLPAEIPGQGLPPYDSTMPNIPMAAHYDGGGVQRIGPYEADEASFIKKHGIRLILGGVAGLILLLALTSSPKKAAKLQETTSQSVDTVMTFDKLSPENKSAVVDTYNLVRNLIRSGKYELCLQELIKLHTMVPFYEDSRELVQECRNATQLAQQKADYDYRQQEKLRRQREIETITTDCQDKINKNPNISSDELRACLGHAIELDPENPKILELTNLLKVREEERIERQKMAANHHARVLEAEAQYKIAHQKAKSGRLHEAVDDYQRFLNGNFPSDVAPLKEKARREVSSVQKQLSSKVSRLLATCHENLEKAHYRPAYEACANATAEDPSNSQAQDLSKQALSELRREMKAIYEDSVLEESLGNIDSAKEKWKHLMLEDLQSDEYYNKAKLKLQKYGVGI